MKKKFSSFKAQITEIEKLLTDGYTYQEVNKKLLDNYGINLSLGTFRNYLYRCRAGALKSNTEIKTVLDNNLKPNIENDNETKLVESEDDSDSKNKQVFANRRSGDSFINNLLNQDNQS